MLDRYLNRIESRQGRRIVVTPDFRTTYESAEKEAQELGHHFVGIDHLWLGILKNGHPVINSLKVNCDEARSQLERGIGRGENIRVHPSGLFLTSCAQEAIDLSASLADKLGHPEVDIEHLTIGVLQAVKERGSSLLPYTAKRLGELQASVIRYKMRF